MDMVSHQFRSSIVRRWCGLISTDGDPRTVLSFEIPLAAQDSKSSCCRMRLQLLNPAIRVLPLNDKSVPSGLSPPTVPLGMGSSLESGYHQRKDPEAKCHSNRYTNSPDSRQDATNHSRASS